MHREDIQDKERRAVHAKGMGVGTAWLIIEPNGLKCLEHKVVGEMKRWGVAEDQKRWGVGL